MPFPFPPPNMHKRLILPLPPHPSTHTHTCKPQVLECPVSNQGVHQAHTARVILEGRGVGQAWVGGSARVGMGTAQATWSGFGVGWLGYKDMRAQGIGT